MNLARLIQDELEEPLPWWRRVYEWITYFVAPDQLGYMIIVTVATIVSAMGATIRSGETALLFTFGRAGIELQPGFRILIPFLQVVRRMPSRSRTLDLPAQRVVTREGLVFHVDANLVYRVVDIRKAVIEIDKLRKGMLQILGLAVQETLREMTRRDVDDASHLTERLTAALESKLAPWGVEVEQAGLTTITPSATTLRVTQFARATHERVRVLQSIEKGGLARASALGLIGARQRFVRRTTRNIALEIERGSRRRVRAALLRAGIPAAELGALEKRRMLRLPGERHSNFRDEDLAAESKPALASARES